MNIKEASKYSIRNFKELKKSVKAGCYYCLKIYDSNQIIEWTDDNDTALCPFCGIDSVLPETAPFDLSKEVLTELKKFWF